MPTQPKTKPHHRAAIVRTPPRALAIAVTAVANISWKPTWRKEIPGKDHFRNHPSGSPIPRHACTTLARMGVNFKELEEGLSGVFSVGEDAQTLQVFLAGDEVARRELSLDPEDVNRIRIELP